MKRSYGLVLGFLACSSVVACSSSGSEAQPQGDTSSEELTAGGSNIGTGSAYAGQPCQNLFPNLVRRNPAFAPKIVSWDGTGCELDMGESACLANAGYSLHYFKQYTASVSGFTYSNDFYLGTAPASDASRATTVGPLDNGSPPAQIGVTIWATHTIGAVDLWETENIATPPTCFGANRS